MRKRQMSTRQYRENKEIQRGIGRLADDTRAIARVVSQDVPRHSPIGQEYRRYEVDNLQVLRHLAKTDQKGGDHQLE